MKLILSTLVLLTSLGVFADEFPWDPFHRGDRVINTQEETGTISDVFSNGAVKVYYDYAAVPVLEKKNDLYKGIYRFGNFWVGQRVLTSTNETGTIHEIFTNEKARVQIDYVAGTTVLMLKSLSGSN